MFGRKYKHSDQVLFVFSKIVEALMEETFIQHRFESWLFTGLEVKETMVSTPDVVLALVILLS